MGRVGGHFQQIRDDIFGELAARGGFEARYTDGLDEAGWIRRLYDSAREKNLTAGIEMPPGSVGENFTTRGIYLISLNQGDLQRVC